MSILSASSISSGWVPPCGFHNGAYLVMWCGVEDESLLRSSPVAQGCASDLASHLQDIGEAMLTLFAPNSRYMALETSSLF